MIPIATRHRGDALAVTNDFGKVHTGATAHSMDTLWNRDARLRLAVAACS